MKSYQYAATNKNCGVNMFLTMHSALFLVQPKITFFNNQTASEFDEQVTLVCEAMGDPTPTISWSFGNRVFTEGEQVQLAFALCAVM